MTICEDALPYVWNGNSYDLAGTYTFTTTNTAGCDSIATLELTVKEISTSTTPVTVCAYDLPYRWNNIDYTAAGTYTFTTTNAVDCDSIATLILTVTEPVAIVVPERDTLTCATTSITLDGSASSGVNATYSWSDGTTILGTTNMLTVTLPGTYTLTVTDENGCESTDQSIIILETNTMVLTTSETDVSCYGLSDGSATVVVMGGTPPFTYQWSDPAAQTTATANNLPAGTFTVIVTDNHGCVSSTLVTITQPNLLIPTEVHTNVTAPLGSDGSINLSVTGGTQPYTYAWTGPNDFTATTQDISNLESGTYTVIVTDANGCQATLEVKITEPSNMVCPPALAFECFDDVPAAHTTLQQLIDAGGSVTGTCGFDLTAAITHTTVMSATTCPRILTRTYFATDLCGTEVSCQQIITINDITPPVISCPDTLFLDEGDPIPAAFTSLTTFRADGGIATDNCSLVDESFNLVFSDTIDARMSITILRDYTVADSCDNNDICRHVIFIKKGCPHGDRLSGYHQRGLFQ